VVLLLFKYIWLGNTGKNKARLTPNLAWIKSGGWSTRVNQNGGWFCGTSNLFHLQHSICEIMVSAVDFPTSDAIITGQWNLDWFVHPSITYSSTFIGACKKIAVFPVWLFCGLLTLVGKKENYFWFIFSAWLLSVYGVKQAVLFLWLKMLLMICILGDNRLHKDSVNYKRENCLCCTKCNTHLHGWRKGII